MGYGPVNAPSSGGSSEELEAVRKLAQGAADTADAAKNTADTAKATADAALEAANAARGVANTAKSTADQALALAGTAKDTADTAKATADQALETANTAKATADGSSVRRCKGPANRRRSGAEHQRHHQYDQLHAVAERLPGLQRQRPVPHLEQL